jgi:flagellin-like protein
LRGKRALSPVVAAIILIAVVVAVGIATAAWMGALTFTFITEEMEIRVDVRLYSVDQNIGVLNEVASFFVAIKNNSNSTRAVDIVVNAEEHVVFNETVVIEPMSSRNVTITQKLALLGLWEIQVFKDKKLADSYSFMTVINEAEADMKITQLENIRLNTNLSIAALTISIISVAVSIASVISERKRHIGEKRTRDEKKETGKPSPTSQGSIFGRVNQHLMLIVISALVATCVCHFLGFEVPIVFVGVLVFIFVLLILQSAFRKEDKP